jgi:hypothetical protein
MSAPELVASALTESLYGSQMNADYWRAKFLSVLSAFCCFHLRPMLLLEYLVFLGYDPNFDGDEPPPGL